MTEGRPQIVERTDDSVVSTNYMGECSRFGKPAARPMTLVAQTVAIRRLANWMAQADQGHVAIVYD